MGSINITPCFLLTSSSILAGFRLQNSPVAYVICLCVFPGEVFLMLHQMSFIALNARLDSFTEASDFETISEELLLTT